MFSKALFKQSCKANGTMWAIITFAVCFMLACVMLISGSDSIGSTITAVEDTIIVNEIEASLETRAINYYETDVDGMAKFDGYFASDLSDATKYYIRLALWQAVTPDGELPVASDKTSTVFAANVSAWRNEKPSASDFASDAEYNAAIAAWEAASPISATGAATAAYIAAISDLQEYLAERALAIDPSYTADTDEALEIIGSVMYAINPDGMFDEFYNVNGEAVPDAYDVESLAAHVVAGDIADYLASDERAQYISSRSERCAAIFLAGNITLPENVDKIVRELASFGVSPQKYASFGYDYDNVKRIADNTLISYRYRLAHDLIEVNAQLENGEITQSEYDAAVAKLKSDLNGEIASSLLASLPEDVAAALAEIGQIDLYSLVVGSIFYKLAGLLLPIIFMIMASNNLIAGQVDSGSMAYVLSTSTKRKTVVFTQAVFLISSLLSMFTLTTITGCVCLAIVKSKVALTYGQLILLNLGAFFVLFAMSGLCFLTSCWFDRSKRSMAVGGGLSIFALVAAMLGLFGSSVIPSVVRLDALNNFNYVTVISLFDAISIIGGTTTFIWKFAILLALGALGYAIGAVKFIKKDLPL